MYALVTGAGGGIGKDMAIMLCNMGYDMILVGRNKKRLDELSKRLDCKSIVISTDLSVRKNCFKLYDAVKELDIEVVINNAGYGTFGMFTETGVKRELNMIDLNICCVHILTKLFLRNMVKKDRGYIMNVSSLAAYGAGPLMSSYYGTKAYVLKLTEAINQELSEINSGVHICALCPGPVDTNFNRRAGVKFGIRPMKSKAVASYALKCMFKRKMVILPGMTAKITAALSRIAPERLILEACYKIQKRKGE